MKKETVVLIVGAGPAGLATSACLNVQNIPNIVLEREAKCASIWREKSYDRLKLHLAKEFCQLPHMPFSPNAPTFLSKEEFAKYLDTYTSYFSIKPLYQRVVVSASCNEENPDERWWLVRAKNTTDEEGEGEEETYTAKFLVVATGENGEGFIPPGINGLHGFSGEIMHSSQYKNGKKFQDKSVLVVGSGNSGMEIAYDLSDHGARTSIVVRNPVHVLTKEMVQLGMTLLKFLPLDIVDKLVVALSMWKFGDLSPFGLQRPNKGPFYTKRATRKSPVIDVGTSRKIKTGEIKVFPALKKVAENRVEFENGKAEKFEAIVFATGYRSTVRKWLMGDDDGLFNEDGMPREKPPNHWKGKNGIYSAGFAGAGLAGISNDALNIAEDIQRLLITQFKMGNTK